MKGTFNEEDAVLLIYDRRRRWIRYISEGEFHCNYGSVDLTELIGKSYGYRITTSKGKELKSLPPSIIDWINDAFEHKSQIIYEKDAAMISMLLDLKPGDVVYEAGTGSGSLTAIMARKVGPSGKIITHDNREQAYEVAQRNAGKLGLENIEFHLRDIKEDGFVTGTTSALVLDMGDPWRIIDKTTSVMNPGARIVIFLPTFDQLGKTAEELERNKYENIKAIELLEREIQLKPGAIRPATRMIGHTGFLVSATYLP